MNKFLTNFQRTGAMFPVANNFFSDFWKGGSGSSEATQPAGTAATPETTQQAQGSSQIAVGLENAKGEEKPENIWEEKKDKDGNVIVPEAQKVIFGDLTMEQTNEMASKVNFISEEDNAMIHAIVGDDAEKQEALRKMFNIVGQRAFAQSTLTTAKGLGGEVSKSLDGQDPRIRQAVDEQLKMTALTEEFPMATNPTTRPIFELIAKQVMKQHPHASRSEIMSKTQKQIENLQNVSGAKTTTATEKAPVKEDTSWDTFFEEAGR